MSIKHGVPFEYAVRVFLDPHRLDSEDTRRDCSEERRLTIGVIEGRLLVVAYTPRDTVIRLISAMRRLLHSRAAFGIGLPLSAGYRRQSLGCGCSSVVEHDLAKVGVEGSNPFARSSFSSRELRAMGVVLSGRLPDSVSAACRKTQHTASHPHGA